MKKFLLAASLLPLTTGCSILGDQLDKAAKGAGKLVSFYCENVTIPEVRDELRAAVNAHAAPNSVQVTCANGGPTLKSGE